MNSLRVILLHALCKHLQKFIGSDSIQTYNHIQAHSQEFSEGGYIWMSDLYVHMQPCKTRGVWGHAPPGN